ncbi:hypothetical protein [Carboxylicivirga taeanensis]|uniref:hypothetical protein n=1 Tax=Carboxylicivirga taeanensis TaxID=1416875 RepID=UPI003F6DD002
MSKSRKLVLTPIATLALLALIIFELLLFFNQGNKMTFQTLNLLVILGHLIGLACLYSTTQLKQLLSNRLIMAGIIGMGIGMIMKIMHLPFGAYTLLIAAIYLIGASIYYFTRYSSKNTANYLKIIWLPLFLMAIIFKMNHFPGAHKILFTASVVIWLIVIHYCYSGMNKR